MLSREENELLTQTGPGTVMGELFRRFWLPALLSTELPSPDCPPIKLTLLSEDLVAFRDSTGQVGVLDRYCPHRGSSLFWGRNEEEGLRCVYHGWKFDVGGTCVDMPNEPVESRFKEKSRTLAYPAQERGGVIWVYMGPKELNPELPDLEWTRVPENQRYVSKRIQICNWLQNAEGEVDSSHVSFLHGLAPAARTGLTGLQRISSDDPSPQFTVKRTDHGIMVMARRNAGSEGFYWRMTPFMLPSYTLIPTPPDSLRTFTGAIPIDDTHMFGFTVSYRPDKPLTAEDLEGCTNGLGVHVKLLPGSFNMVENEDNDFQIDRELQRTQSYTGIRGGRTQDAAVQSDQWGPVTKRWLEHLGTTDLAIIAMRRHLLKRATDTQRGIEPPEAHNGAAYRVRSVAAVFGPQVEFEQAAAELIRA